MKRSAAILLIILSLGIYFYMEGASMQSRQDDSETIKAIARDIAILQKEFPQLKNFSTTKSINLENLSISYEFHTHKAEHRGGWTSGVPNPDEDGVWFYIDLHSPDSQAQIHTQPVTPNICIGEKKVSFLILEGKNTAPIGGHIWTILKKHGAKPCKD